MRPRGGSDAAHNNQNNRFRAPAFAGLTERET